MNRNAETKARNIYEGKTNTRSIIEIWSNGKKHVSLETSWNDGAVLIAVETHNMLATMQLPALLKWLNGGDLDLDSELSAEL